MPETNRVAEETLEALCRIRDALSSIYSRSANRRERLAAAALAGLLADPEALDKDDGKTIAETYAEQAVLYADALIDALDSVEE